MYGWAWRRWVEGRSPNCIVTLAVVREAKASVEAEELRAFLRHSCENAFETVGDDISGYALVVWDKIGDLHSAYRADKGPIGPALVPTLVGDALNRHLAVMLAKDAIETEGDRAG